MKDISKTPLMNQAITDLKQLVPSITINDAYCPRRQIKGDGYFSYDGLNMLVIRVDESIEGDQDLLEAVYIHEVLHVLLGKKGLPYAVPASGHGVNQKADDIAALLTGALQHPMIYQRMKNAYHLNMDRYFKHLSEEQKKRIRAIIPTVEQLQLNAIMISEYSHYDAPYQDDVLQLVRTKLSEKRFARYRDVLAHIETFYPTGKNAVDAKARCQFINSLREGAIGLDLNNNKEGTEVLRGISLKYLKNGRELECSMGL